MHRHFTATAFITDSRGRTLLLFHKRLGRWMPPGGHIDEDEMPEETARRECKEETGLDVEILGDDACVIPSGDEGCTTPCHGSTELVLSRVEGLTMTRIHSADLFKGHEHEGQMLKKPIAMLLENIPACPERGEPEHQHMDFLFRARPLDEAQIITLAEDEGREIRWFTREEVAALPEEEIFGNVKAYILAMLP